jgi:hypothetical protein
MAERGEVVDPLTDDEFDDRERLEKIVDQGLSAFMDVGLALAEISTRRLYRSTDSTFVAYLSREWGMSESSGYRYIDAATVTSELLAAIEAAPEDSPIGEAVPPQNEAQARELTRFKGQPEKAAAAMRLASEDGPPTAKKVKEAAQVVSASKPPERTPRQPADEPRPLSPRDQKIADDADRLARNLCDVDPSKVLKRTVKRLEAFCANWRETQ